MMPPEVSSVVRRLIQQSKTKDKPTVNTITMCVKKKCPDGNFPINIGKMMYPNFNAHGCLYMPDTTRSSDGSVSSTCKAGKVLSVSDKAPDMCVSTPQIYFPLFQ